MGESQRRHLSAKEVAALVGESPGTVKRRTREGKLPAAFKLPGHSGAYVYDEATVVAYIAERGVPEQVAS